MALGVLRVLKVDSFGRVEIVQSEHGMQVRFQIALCFSPRCGPLRRRLFAMLRREDHRHVLKQKRSIGRTF